MIMCEQCGETAAFVFTGHAALCADCYGNSAREALQEAGLGNLCGRFITRNNGQHAVCVQPYGTEHDHSS